MLVAAFGWDGQPWCDGFYPPELPEEWRLAYYANAYRAVVVPREYWLAAGPDELTAWADEVDGSFRFFLETGTEELGLLEQPLNCLGERLGGVVVSGALTGEEACLRSVQGLQERGVAVALVCDARPNETTCNALEASEIGACWSEGDSIRCSKGRLIVAFGVATMAPRQRREVVETMCRLQGQEALYVVRDTAGVPLALQELRLMVELLGCG